MEIKENLFYNGLQKKRYLENCRYDEPTKKVIDMWFRQTAKVEEQEGCDLANFNRPQVHDLLKALNSRSRETLKGVCVYLSDYYSWCIAEGLVDNGNIVNQYDSKMVNNIIDKIIPLNLVAEKFMKKADILRYLDMIPDPCNKFIMYALYLGVYGQEYEDLKNLRLDDINKERKIVHLKSGKILNIDDTFIELAKEADKQLMYYPEGIKSAEYTQESKRYEYVQSCYIIKICRDGTVNTPVDHGIIMTRLRLMQKQTRNRYLNGANLYKSGMINYIVERYAEQGITFRQALLQKSGKREYQYDKETQKYINEFGSNMTVRMLRLQLADYIELFD